MNCTNPLVQISLWPLELVYVIDFCLFTLLLATHCYKTANHRHFRIKTVYFQTLEANVVIKPTNQKWGHLYTLLSILESSISLKQHPVIIYQPSLITLCYCQKPSPCRKRESAALYRVYYITLSLCNHNNIVWINRNSKELAFYFLTPSIFKIRTPSGGQRGACNLT